MFFDLFIALATSLQLWLSGVVFGQAQPPAPAPAAAPAQPTRVAQAEPKDTARTAADRAAGHVMSLESLRRGAMAEKQALLAAQRKQLAEVDRLKRRKASWRRDRQLESALADSQETAAQLSRVDRRILAIDKRLKNAYRVLHERAVAEARAGARGERRRQLVGWVRIARKHLRNDRKIVLPDHRIDPLADPEDLEYQAQRIAQSERELEREIQALVARETRLQRMQKMRTVASRAARHDRLDDDRPRRNTGRLGEPGGADRGNGAGGFGAEADDSASPPSPQDPTSDGLTGGGAGESDPTVVLADVVDATTLSQLRRAESSGDPGTKAAAIRRARKDVSEQLERLRNARKKIQQRARSLRRNR